MSETTPNEPNSLLPIVSYEVMHALAQDMQSDAFLMDTVWMLDKENPVLGQALGVVVAETAADYKTAQLMTTAAALIYHGLRNQAVADEMNGQIQ